MPGAPDVGTIVDGYEFMGGNHRDRTSWRRSPYGPRANSTPDGNVVITGPRGGTQIIRRAGGRGGAAGGGGAPVREFEANASARATLMDQGDRDYERARASGYDPGTLGNTVAMGVEALPLVGPYAARLIRDDPADLGRAAELTYTEGALRTTTGANAPPAEVRNAARMYFRQPGEPAAVDPQRQTLRRRFRDTAVNNAGAAYHAPPPDGEALLGFVQRNAATAEAARRVPRGSRAAPAAPTDPSRMSDAQLRQILGF